MENNKVDKFLAKLPVKELYSGNNLIDIVERSGLPKEDFLHNAAFCDFAIAYFSISAGRGGDLGTGEDAFFIEPMIAKDSTFAGRLLEVAKNGTPRYDGYNYTAVQCAADVATLSDADYVRNNAFHTLSYFISREVNVINCLLPRHINNLKDPDRFMSLIEKQINDETKNMKSLGAAYQFDENAIRRLKEFSEKFPDYKEEVGLLVKKAKDNNLLCKDRYPVMREANDVIGDIPAAKLEKIRQRMAEKVGLKKVKMPSEFKGVERKLSQMIFEKKSGRSEM